VVIRAELQEIAATKPIGGRPMLEAYRAREAIAALAILVDTLAADVEALTKRVENLESA
jgi:hypothetical protein